MKKIKLDGFETRDGRVFTDKGEANKHELRCAVIGIFEGKYIYDMTSAEVADMIVAGRDELLKALTDE